MRTRLALFLTSVLLTGAYGQMPSELRGVWLTNVDSNVLSTDAAIVEAMDYLATLGINVIFPVVYNKGYTLYPSAIMQERFGAPVLPGSPFAGRDFLDRLTIEAHRNGIEVIPWFEFGFSTSYSLNGGHILAKYPDWALKDRFGNLVVDNGFDWMSPLHPGARDFMISLMMETLDNYHVDGVQGDDRLPAMPVEGGYDSVTTQLYKAEHQGQAPPLDHFNTAWMRWRADKLTQLLSRIRDSVKVRGEHTILSVAPAPFYWGYRELLQDSKSWAQQHLIDNLIPQLYQYNFADYSYALNTTWNDVGQYDAGVFTAGLLARAGVYVADTTFLGQMITAGRNKGANGHCFFFYEALRANTNRIGTYLRERFYQEPALLPYRMGNLWRPKGLIVNETDPSAVKTGTWASYPMRGHEGSIIRTQDTLAFAGMSYAFTVPAIGWYDVYVYRVPNTPWTTQAVYTLFGGTDSTVVTVDQSDLAKKGWHTLGTVHLNAGTRTVVKLDNSRLEPGRYLTADAVMLMVNRKLSPDAVLTASHSEGGQRTLPRECSLEQNYPNPFNPSTTMEFTVATGEARWVRLVIYDVLGREVDVLVDGKKAPGSHVVRWNAAGLPSGVYFCRMSAGAHVQTRSMVLIK